MLMNKYIEVELREPGLSGRICTIYYWLISWQNKNL